MKPHISFVTLGVSNLEIASRFYEEILKLPRLKSPPGVTFFEMGRTWLALFPRLDLASDAGVSAEGNGFRQFALAHNVSTPEEVDLLISEAARGGGRVMKAPRKADWGGYSGYFADPDGFLWEVAWNPRFPHVQDG